MSEKRIPPAPLTRGEFVRLKSTLGNLGESLPDWAFDGLARLIATVETLSAQYRVIEPRARLLDHPSPTLRLFVGRQLRRQATDDTEE